MCDPTGFDSATLKQRDFYSQWPRFEAAELIGRFASGLPPEKATLLTKANLTEWAINDPRRFEKWCAQVNEMKWEMRAEMAARVLDSAGMSEAVISATRRLNRSNFMPRRYASLAFLNLSSPLAPGSNATMFGLSALVIEAADRLQPERVIEVGFGSGLTAATLVNTCNSVSSYFGYEPNGILAPLWDKGSKISERLSVVTPIWAPFNIDTHASIPTPRTLLLFSCAVNEKQYRALWEIVRNSPGLCCIVPRPLTPEEFHCIRSEQVIKWRKRPVDTYAEYTTNVRAYMVLELIENISGSAKVSLLCANIQYIAYHEEPQLLSDAEPFSLGPLKILLWN